MNERRLMDEGSMDGTGFPEFELTFVSTKAIKRGVGRDSFYCLVWRDLDQSNDSEIPLYF